MFTGFNSNVELDGRTFHVQTEDGGLDNPVLETRVYSGGRVVASISHSYADLAASPDYSQDRIQRRMQEQHQGLIADLEKGRLEAEPRARLRGEIADPDPANLLDEFVEDWIDSAESLVTVQRCLEQEVDAVQAGATHQKKKPSESESGS